jgi:hypothetical protein
MKKTLVCIGVCAVLSACGGGSGGGTPAPQNSAQLQPLSSQQTYIGTVSFGDTISVQLDAPSAGQVTVSFVNSQFGLAGQLVGTYAPQGTGSNYVVSNLQASGTNVPALLSAGASGIGFTFNIVTGGSNNNTLSGQLTNVPNVTAGTGTLAGQVAASNNGVTTLAALAGTYSFIKLSGNYSSQGVPVGDQDADSGQIKINADGSFRACLSAAYSDTCMDDEDSTTADTGTITIDADQTTYPGAFDMTVNGTTMGRLFVSTTNGQNTLMLDQAGTNSGGTFRTGSWVFQSTQALVSGTYDGTWSCAEPDTSDTNQLLGTITSKFVTITGSTLTPSGSSNSVTLNYNTTFNAAASSSTPTLVTGAVNGIMSGLLYSQASPSAMMFLPVSSSSIYYLDEANGNGFFVEGLCTRVQTPS